MSIFEKTTFRTKIFFVISVFTFVSIFFIIISGYLIDKVIQETKTETEKLMIGSKLFKEIEDIKDLKADILPPPLFLIEVEAFLFETLMLDSRSEINRKINWYIEFKKTYLERKNIWEDNLSEDEMKTELLSKALPLAEDIFSIIDKEFIPQLNANNKNACYNILQMKVLPKFNQHKSSIVKVANLADTKSENIVKKAETTKDLIYNNIQMNSAKTITYMTIVSLFLLLLFVAITIFIINNILKNLILARNKILNIAEGKV